MVFFGIAFSFLVKAQEDESSYYSWFDQTIGETNSGVYYGIEYREQYRGDKEQHKFFLKPNFVAGQVVYKQQPFFAIDLLYDVFDDELLVRHVGINGSPIVQLIKSNVASFEIAGHYFVNLQTLVAQEAPNSGFFEILFAGRSFTLYKKHLKKILRKSDQESVYYTFKNRQNYYIQYGTDFFKMASARDLSTIFPGNKKELQQIQDRHREFRKSAPEHYLIAVSTDLDSVISITENRNEP